MVMIETVRLYKDKSRTLWKGPLYCGEETFFATLDLAQQTPILDPLWEAVEWRFGMSLDVLNEFLPDKLDINASLAERARQVAIHAHQGQTRWNEDDYVTHPIRVAQRVKEEDEQVVAYLHDVIEDTDVSRGDLESFGFTELQLESLDSVTKRPRENYRDFVLRARANPVGCAVKVADINDNLRDLDRKRNKTARDKYELALWILEH